MNLNTKFITTIISSCIIALGANQANAAGYSSSLYSTSGIGNAYAGSATGAHDSSDLFFNPSLSVNFDKPQLVVSVNYLDLDIDADNVDARLDDNSQVSGGGGDEAGEDAIVPSLYFSTPINERLAFGLSINSPFGLATKYDKESAIRNKAVESSITTININPSVSYKVRDNLSIGVGLAVQYYEVTMSKIARVLGSDYYTKIKGDDWGYGYNLGLNYQYNDDLSFGAGYRSKIDHKIEGDVGVTFGNTNSAFSSATTTPESLTAGLKYQASDKTEIVYDTTWTRWSRLNSFVGKAENSLLNSQIDFNWKDSLMYSLGVNHRLNSKLLLRSGLAYETGATSDIRREPRIPTGDRTWLTAGLNYKITDSFSIDAAYVHQFHDRERVALADDTDETLNNDVGTLNYTTKTRVSVYSLGIKKEF